MAPEIIGLGLATVDVVLCLDRLPTWDNSGGLQSFLLDGGGPVGTACVAASRLGARVSYLGVAGDDLMGEIKLRTLAERGVEISRVIKRQQPENQVVVVYVNRATGERMFAGVRKFDSQPLQPEELDQKLITSATYLHLDGTHPQAALQAARWMRQAGKKVMLDGSSTRQPISPALQELVHLSNILICGAGFGASLTGLSDPWDIGAAILKLGPQVVVQTEGKDGCYTATPPASFHTPAFDVPVVDTCGAGDVFHGAYLVGLLHGWSHNIIARFASAVAAIKCTQLGGRPGIPDFNQTAAFLQARGYPLPNQD